MPKKLTYNYVKKIFEEGGCELLSDEYVNNITKLKYKCSCGEMSEISFSNFKRGSRCRECGYKKNAKNQKHTYEFVKNYFENYDCILLSKKYENAFKILKYRCSCGNISNIIFNSFQQGGRCKKCGVKKVANKTRHSYKCIKKYFKDNNCILKSKTYKNEFALLNYICICGSNSIIRFKDFKRGSRCKQCGNEKRSGKNHYNYNPNLTDEDRMDRRLLSDYRVWVKKVFIKNDYTCQRCNKRGSITLNAHHIESWGSCVKLRFNKNNGITFCIDCHIKFHKKYGYGNNTKKQIDEYLKVNS